MPVTLASTFKHRRVRLRSSTDPTSATVERPRVGEPSAPRPVRRSTCGEGVARDPRHVTYVVDRRAGPTCSARVRATGDVRATVVLAGCDRRVVVRAG